MSLNGLPTILICLIPTLICLKWLSTNGMVFFGGGRSFYCCYAICIMQLGSSPVAPPRLTRMSGKELSRVQALFLRRESNGLTAADQAGSPLRTC